METALGADVETKAIKIPIAISAAGIPQLTRDLPRVSEARLKHLDESPLCQSS